MCALGNANSCKGKQSANSRESSESDEESEVSGKDWLAIFSTMSVGPPRHVKDMKGVTNAMATPTETGQRDDSEGCRHGGDKQD